jgi:hypothetical protein
VGILFAVFMINLFTPAVSRLDIEEQARELGMIYPEEARAYYLEPEEEDDD